MSGPFPDDGKEGWGVPQRLPFLAAAALLVLLFGGVSIGARVYLATMAPATRPPPIDFPLPRLEIVRSIPGQPHRAVTPPPPDGIDRAIAETAAAGNATWGANAR